MIKMILAALCFLLLGVSAFKLADGLQKNNDSVALQIERAYAYATAPRQKNGAVFGEFHNKSAVDMRIVSAAADVSERAELHTHLHEGGIMMMREVEGYDVPRGDAVTLEPSGHHIMLMGLKSPLVEGERFTLTLTNEAGETFEADIAILAPGTEP